MKKKNLLIALVVAVIVAYVYLNMNAPREGMDTKVRTTSRTPSSSHSNYKVRK